MSIEVCEHLFHQVGYSREWDSWYCLVCNKWHDGSTWNPDRPDKPNGDISSHESPEEFRWDFGGKQNNQCC